MPLTELNLTGVWFLGLPALVVAVCCHACLPRLT